MYGTEDKPNSKAVNMKKLGSSSDMTQLNPRNNDNDNYNDNDNDNDNDSDIYPGSPLALAVFSGALQIIITK